ncbi:MAG: repressor LexA [Lentisphaerae bacterium]|nr:repressor LexA [Lentisphaerota bacterium]
MKQELTDRQMQVLGYVRECVRANGFAPSSREIMARFGFASPRAVTDHLNAIEAKGHITRSSGKARNIRLAHPAGGIPILGVAPAGRPLEAVEERMGTLDVNSMFGTPDSLFAVEVKGDSMSEAGILNGDYAVVRKQPSVPNGAIALAYLDGEATIKTFRKTAYGYRLEPRNPAYHPIEITSATRNFVIGGLVVGVVRRMDLRQGR